MKLAELSLSTRERQLAWGTQNPGVFNARHQDWEAAKAAVDSASQQYREWVAAQPKPEPLKKRGKANGGNPKKTTRATQVE